MDYIVSPRSSPFPLDFGLRIWDLDLGLGFGIWIWDLDLGLDLGLTIIIYCNFFSSSIVDHENLETILID